MSNNLKFHTMKKTIFTLSIGLICVLTQANSLLTNPQTGQPFTSGAINDIQLVSNGTDVALIIANNTTRSLYAIDINDNNPADAAANTITQIPNFKSEIEAAIGVNNITIQNFEVNPISKSVYVWVSDESNNYYIVVVRNNGTNISSFNLTNVNYVSINYTTGDFIVQDMSWGNNTLYVSSGSKWALDGEVGTISAPFAHNSSTTNRATSMFVSKWWGEGSYLTNAPLEKFDFTTINNVDRLAGVTVCAPGFSFETTALTGAGLLQVEEQFNVNTSPPVKIIAVEQNDTSYLFDLHMGTNNLLIRIGEKYIDGSRIAANQYNNNSVYLRNGSNRPAGLTDADVIIYKEGFRMIAYYDDYQFLVWDYNDVLRLFNTLCGLVTANFSYEENPSNSLTVDFAANNVANATYSWDFGDGNFSNGLNATHTYNAAGTYTVCLTVKNNCSIDTLCTNVLVTGPAGIKSFESIPKIVIYPNPATERIFIHQADNFAANSQLIIYSLDGKEMHKDFLTGKNQQIQVSSWPKGVYLVAVLTGRQKVFQDRFVIN